MPQLIRKLKWVLLLGGDGAVLYLALWITLKIRYGELFGNEVWMQHVIPFSIVYVVWICIFYIFGLYDLTLAKNNLSFYTALLRSLFISAFIGIALFYLTPAFGIAPKTNLVLNTFFVFLLFSSWRQLYNFLIKYPLLSHRIILVGKKSSSS